MEDLVQYGTPLQSLDESNIHLSKAPKLSDQIVTDKQGKRRFHGAFTGGFSAGYFNSVGTKEGWTPSTFVSTRSKRADKVAFDPKTFMDEEDLDDFGIASQKIQASSDYEDPFADSNKRKRMEDWAGPIPGQPVLKDLLKPVNITIGMKFLMKLGWRPGQGVGPRVSRREKKISRKEKRNVLTFDVTSSSESDEEDSLYESRSFAPDDVEDSLLLNVKSNVFGLGYKPLERTNVLGANRQSEFSNSFRMTDNKKKLSIRGQGFGVGAFEEQDDDIYMKEDMSDYDFDLGPSKEISPKKKEKSRWDFHVSLMGEVLEGFHLSSKPLDKPKKGPLPSLPVDFKPWHESFRRKFSPRDLVNKDRLTADDRRNIIDKTPVVEIRSGVKKQEEESGTKNITDMVVENLQRDVSSTLSDYKPFAAVPEKQKRYEAYISSKGIDKGNIFPYYMTEWEKEREKGEFKRAQAFNRPLSFGMSARFTTAVHDDCNNQLQEGLNDMKGNIQQQTEEKVPFYAVEMKEDMKAAKEKMFGQLTQCQVEWHPDKLLCKRFNVPNPFPSSTSVGVRSSKKENFSLFSVLPTTSNTLLETLPDPEPESEEEKINTTDIEKTSNIEEDYGLKVPVTNPPTIDLFNAIFQDSSDSETEENGKSDVEIITENTSKENSTVAKSSKENLNKFTSYGEKHSDILENDKTSNKKENNLNLIIRKENRDWSTSSSSSSSVNVDVSNSSRSLEKAPELKETEAKGIFKGIDFTILNQYRSLSRENKEEETSSGKEISLKTDSRRRRDSSSDSSSHSNDSIIGPQPDVDEEEEYGPALPPHMIGTKSSVNPDVNITSKPISHFSSLEEIERKIKKAKKQKKKHKHKHKKHKKESKHRR